MIGMLKLILNKLGKNYYSFENKNEKRTSYSNCSKNRRTGTWLLSYSYGNEPNLEQCHELNAKQRMVNRIWTNLTTKSNRILIVMGEKNFLELWI